MKWTFGPEDENAFFAARDGLVERFERSVVGDGLGWVASQVLDFKWGYLDGDLARWSPSDVESILLDLYPAKVVLDTGDEPVVLAGFEALLGFLAEEGILEGGPAHAARVSEGIGVLADVFVRAMADESRWGMGRRLVGQAAREGIDVSDQAGLERWMTEFNSKSYAERDRILGPSPSSAVTARALGSLPPVVLAPAEALEAAAAASVWVQRVTGLVSWVCEGRALTTKGNLKLADAKVLVDLLDTGDSFRRADRRSGLPHPGRGGAAAAGSDLPPCRRERAPGREQRPCGARPAGRGR